MQLLKDPLLFYYFYLRTVCSKCTRLIPYPNYRIDFLSKTMIAVLHSSFINKYICHG